MFIQNVGQKSKIFKVKSAILKFYLLIVLAINATIGDDNYHWKEGDMTKLSHESLIERCNMHIKNKSELHTRQVMDSRQMQKSQLSSDRTHFLE